MNPRRWYASEAKEAAALARSVRWRVLGLAFACLFFGVMGWAYSVTAEEKQRKLEFSRIVGYAPAADEPWLEDDTREAQIRSLPQVKLVGYVQSLASLFLFSVTLAPLVSLAIRSVAGARGLRHPEASTAISVWFRGLTAEMNIASERVRLYVDPLDLATAPYVRACVRHDELIAPVGLVVLARKEPDLARAMIAHELGHVVQQDAWLQGATGRAHNAFVVAYPVVLVLTTAINAVLLNGAVGVPTGAANLFSVVWVWKWAKRTRQVVGSARLISEVKADAAALVYAGASPLLEALHRYARPLQQAVQSNRFLQWLGWDRQPEHPSPDARLATAQSRAAFFEANGHLHEWHEAEDGNLAIERSALLKTACVALASYGAFCFIVCLGNMDLWLGLVATGFFAGARLLWLGNPWMGVVMPLAAAAALGGAPDAEHFVAWSVIAIPALLALAVMKEARTVRRARRALESEGMLFE